MTPLAELLATRIRLQSEFAETEVPYGEAYAVKAAAGWSPAELTEVGATEPTPATAHPAAQGQGQAAAAAAGDSGTVRAGYTHSTYLVMLHAGPVPAGGPADEVDLDAIRIPLARRWRGLLPDVDDEVIRHLVDRREARRRGADVVRFLGARTEEGEVASWADLYLDPATGTAQIEDLITSEAHLRRGYADAVLTTALRLAADKDCETRFLTADATGWPRHWYERRGFSVIGQSHCFERG
ncbi:GNAT family N-acetyltransferase [Streptomyces sp. NPDC058655]|uniref:GNAT family N-acetyltransferase n=1 Tax=Streptomyces sp. NPDC058655 TaxID=3346577 RepID=UPI0036616C85